MFIGLRICTSHLKCNPVTLSVFTPYKTSSLWVDGKNSLFGVASKRETLSLSRGRRPSDTYKLYDYACRDTTRLTLRKCDWIDPGDISPSISAYVSLPLTTRAACKFSTTAGNLHLSRLYSHPSRWSERACKLHLTRRYDMLIATYKLEYREITIRLFL